MRVFCLDFVKDVTKREKTKMKKYETLENIGCLIPILILIFTIIMMVCDIPETDSGKPVSLDSTRTERIGNDPL